LYILAVRGLDVLAIVLALALASFARSTIRLGQPLAPRSGAIDETVYVIAVGIWMVTSSVLGLYRVRRSIDPLRQSVRATGILLAVCALFAGALYFSFRDVSRLLFGYFFVFSAVGLIGVRLALLLLLRWVLPLEQRIAIVGTGPIARTLAQSVRNARSGIPRSRLVGFIRAGESEGGPTGPEGVLGDTDELTRLIVEHDVHEVIIALPPGNEQRTGALAPTLRELGVGLRIVPDLVELAATGATVESLDGVPVIRLRDTALSPPEQAEKRLVDIVLGATLLLALVPLMALIALAVRISSPGPALFRAQRVGQRGRLFTMYKFRSMVCDAEVQLPSVLTERAPGEAIYKVPNDPRVTRVGRFLRRTSLDELPQLFNVLRGDMTLVGPRPEQPFIVDTYRPWQRRRLEVRPGMTGWWQVNGRELPMNLHTEYDLYYLHNYSLGLDVKILAKTLWAIVHGRGAH
jgi:exopolysaccharide biosynthesis polyprenyl glycosylphosphotransferase